MVSIDQERCKACGVCGTVCPRHVLETRRDNGRKATVVAQERAEICMGCGQCAAVCPTEAIRVEGLASQGYRPVPPLALDYGGLTDFLARRRSVRRYKDQPVGRDILGRIAAAAGLAPAGAGRAATGLLIIDGEAKLKELSGQVFSVYRSLEKALANPIGRFMVRRSAGSHNYKVLSSFVMPGMHWYLRWRDQGAGDEILRDCKALMLLHTHADEPAGKENCVVAAWHAIFAAETLGVGTCMNDLIPPACGRSPEIRRLLDLPEGHEVMVSLTMGYPRYQYRRTIPRELASLRFVD